MNKEPWLYDEMQQVGTDYQDNREIASYEERMSRFRDFRKEAADIIDALGIDRDDRLTDFGAGTGAFALEAAGECAWVTAVDVSAPMLEHIRLRAHERAIRNITLLHAGFLTAEIADGSQDAIVTQLALHHLPDFWKQIALMRLHGFLKKGGVLYIKDVVFSLKLEKYRETIGYQIDTFRKQAGDETAENLVRHIACEYSTYDWIMEEMLYRAGFRIDDVAYQEIIAVYRCTAM